MNFFNLLLYKIFSVSLSNIKYKPIFDFYNITNLTGIIISHIFFIKGLRRIFKYKPNTSKLIKNFFYSFCSIVIFYLFSCILNKYYNKKSEKKFFKLISKLKENLREVIFQLSTFKIQIKEFKRDYLEKALSLNNKLLSLYNINNS